MQREFEYLLVLKSGNELALKLIMERWYGRLFNFANGYLNNVGNTEEVIQDVFIQLWDHRERLSENTSINAFLFTLTRNRCIDVIRRERLTIQFYKDKQLEYNYLKESFNALSDPILDKIFEQEIQSEINSVVGSLPEQCQRVFNLSRVQGLKNREISESLNISAKTVETHITKALKLIRVNLERKFPESFSLLVIATRFRQILHLKQH